MYLVSIWTQTDKTRQVPHAFAFASNSFISLKYFFSNSDGSRNLPIVQLWRACRWLRGVLCKVWRCIIILTDSARVEHLDAPEFSNSLISKFWLRSYYLRSFLFEVIEGYLGSDCIRACCLENDRILDFLHKYPPYPVEWYNLRLNKPDKFFEKCRDGIQNLKNLLFSIIHSSIRAILSPPYCLPQAIVWWNCTIL